MLDSIRLLTNVSDQNTYDVVSTRYLRADTYPEDFYIQLYQKDKEQIYVPGDSATLQIEFLRIDTVERFPQKQDRVLEAEAPFSDKSIWKVTLSKNDIDKIVSGGFRIRLTDTGDTIVRNIEGAGVPGLSRVSNVVTVTTTQPHSFKTGDEVEIAGAADVDFDGTFTIVSVPDNTSFTYSQTDVDADSGGGTVSLTSDQEIQKVIFSEMSIRKLPSSQGVSS